ncbi:hypothetical protein Bca52824_023851 [Brassica carinata]|uniref:Reticulon domain-containing protein n=1 Tax=Brassica carinata TaxID=52824 RepID=A0A8X8AT32_BRACI|nr:hypothetical protein Bca52824_023851 [Brassica carinata]
MWKNKKMSGGVLGGATVAWLLFELMEYHYATSPPKIPEVHIPEEPLLQFASGLRIEINRGFSALHDICIWEGSQEVPFCYLRIVGSINLGRML